MARKTGDKPEKGAYRCDKLGFPVHVCNDGDEPSACPACMHSEFAKAA